MTVLTVRRLLLVVMVMVLAFWLCVQLGLIGHFELVQVGQ
jgi:hypothetical protein